MKVQLKFMVVYIRNKIAVLISNILIVQKYLFTFNHDIPFASENWSNNLVFDSSLL